MRTTLVVRTIVLSVRVLMTFSKNRSFLEPVIMGPGNVPPARTVLSSTDANQLCITWH